MPVDTKLRGETLPHKYAELIFIECCSYSRPNKLEAFLHIFLILLKHGGGQCKNAEGMTPLYLLTHLLTNIFPDKSIVFESLLMFALKSKFYILAYEILAFRKWKTLGFLFNFKMIPQKQDILIHSLMQAGASERLIFESIKELLEKFPHAKNRFYFITWNDPTESLLCYSLGIRFYKTIGFLLKNKPELTKLFLGKKLDEVEKCLCLFYKANVVVPIEMILSVAEEGTAEIFAACLSALKQKRDLYDVLNNIKMFVCILEGRLIREIEAGGRADFSLLITFFRFLQESYKLGIQKKYVDQAIVQFLNIAISPTFLNVLKSDDSLQGLFDIFYDPKGKCKCPQDPDIALLTFAWAPRLCTSFNPLFVRMAAQEELDRIAAHKALNMTPREDALGRIIRQENEKDRTLVDRRFPGTIKALLYRIAQRRKAGELLENISPDYRDQQGATLLHKVAEAMATSPAHKAPFLEPIVFELLSKNADLQAKDKSGRTPREILLSIPSLSGELRDKIVSSARADSEERPAKRQKQV